jgi:GT2 family glycosyltransferase
VLLEDLILEINYANEKLNYTSMLFLDNDVVVAKDFLTEMIKMLEAFRDELIS